MPDNTSVLQKLISPNFLFHALVENEVRLTPYGQITFNVELKDGIAQLHTINVVKNSRKRYRVLDKDKTI